MRPGLTVPDGTLGRVTRRQMKHRPLKRSESTLCNLFTAIAICLCEKERSCVRL